MKDKTAPTCPICIHFPITKFVVSHSFVLRASPVRWPLLLVAFAEVGSASCRRVSDRRTRRRKRLSSRSVDHRYRTFVFKLACRRTPLSALQTDKLPRIRIVVSDPYPYVVASGQKNRMLSAKGQPP